MLDQATTDEPQSHVQVLLVEDDGVMGGVLRRSLERAGLKTTLARNGLLACDCLDRKFDIVVTDYQMPKLNGCEFVRRLRQDPLNRETPVILVTGKGLELDREQLRCKLGVTEVISKPFGPRQLIETICACLELQVDGAQGSES